MIKIQKIKPYTTLSSNADYILRRFNDINGARHYFAQHYGSSWALRRSSQKEEFVYLYRIEKRNLKKKNTKRKQTSAMGNKVVKREVVQKREVKLFIYRFPKNVVKEFKQHARHFTVTLGF